ncbi:hypothetical protein ACFSO7_07855 [Bacillus sp. CGMCC 1.16607]|uniref:hypothetical protein n=1 Tax=Bacillus sp. CGMCC 1.16607 TaxID=3351842 RepID=UPI00362F1C43
MPLRYIQHKYLKYNKGKGFICCHVDALHAMPPAADLFTDSIVERIIEKTGCAGIIGTVSRNIVDLNRLPNGENDEGIKEYRNAINDIVTSLGILNQNNTIIKPYLHLSFHGMKDEHYGPYAIEIGTLKGKSCSPDIKEWLLLHLNKICKEKFPQIKIILDNKFVGNPSIELHRWGDGHSYLGYQQNFHSFQIEISRTLRKKYCKEISEIYSQIITDFQKEFVEPSY